jgi:hypothetical protein
VVHIDDAGERAQRQIGRPSMVASFRKPVLEILGQTPDLASLEILRRVREAGYKGGKTALYALVASLRPKPAQPLIRFEGLAGEFSQHDFGEVEVEFVGRGKTHLAVAIGYRAIQNDFETYFTTAAQLIEDLSNAGRKGQLQESLMTYTHPHVLVVDEVGYLTYGQDAANVLFQ